MENLTYFLKNQKVMTLCVIKDMEPWCAPVYYAFKKRFYFFSSPESIHILYGMGNIVSCSVFTDGNEIKDIKGVQMKGRIYRPEKKEGIEMFIQYLKKFKAILPFENLTLEKMKKNFNSKLYCFKPEYIVYTDNASGFGSKKIIEPEKL